MDYVLNMTIGVASGVTTSAILYLALIFIKNIINPWLKNLLYDGIDISGRWYCSEYLMAQEITIDITQNANRLKGVAIFVTRKSGNHNQFEDIRSFSVSGTIKDRFANLTLTSNDPKRLGVTNYLLEAVGDGRCLNGVLSFYSVRRHTITSRPQKLWRDKSQAQENFDHDSTKGNFFNKIVDNEVFLNNEEELEEPPKKQGYPETPS